MFFGRKKPFFLRRIFQPLHNEIEEGAFYSTNCQFLQTLPMDLRSGLVANQCPENITKA